MTEGEQALIQEAIQGGFIVYCPKGPQALTKTYPELGTYPELKVLTAQDQLFVWLFRCDCSPMADMEDEEKLDICIECAYSSQQTKITKKKAWGDLKPSSFGDKMNAAFGRMANFNTRQHILNYLAMQTYRANCLKLITDPMGDSTEEKQMYMELATAAQKGLNSSLKDIEAGNFGVEKIENTILQQLEGVLDNFRNNG